MRRSPRRLDAYLIPFAESAASRTLDSFGPYLHDTDTLQLLDFDRNGYTIVTYCASQLPEALLVGTEVVIVTCESNAAEIEALRARCASCGIDEAHWAMVGRLKVGQAVVLPITDEAGGQLRPFRIARRLTPHVRHREKYVDVPVSARRAFVFKGNGHAERRVSTLRQFVFELEHTAPRLLTEYISRGDFSRWIADVFGDRALAGELRTLEQQFRTGSRDQTVAEMASIVRGRYDLTADLDAMAR